MWPGARDGERHAAGAPSLRGRLIPQVGWLSIWARWSLPLKST